MKVVFLSIGGLCFAPLRINKDPMQGVASIQNPPTPPSEVDFASEVFVKNSMQIPSMTVCDHKCAVSTNLVISA